MSTFRFLLLISIVVMSVSADRVFAGLQTTHGIGVVTDGRLSYAAAQNFEDAATGDWTTGVWLEAEGPPSEHNFDRDARSQLMIGCFQGRTVVSVVWNSNTGRERPPVMTMWLDDETVESENWTPGENEVSLYRGNTIRLVERLLEARIFTIAFGPGFFDQIIGATFDLSGMDAATEPVRSLCGW